MTLLLTFLLGFGILSVFSSMMVVAAAILASRQKQREGWVEVYEQPLARVPDAQAQGIK